MSSLNRPPFSQNRPVSKPTGPVDHARDGCSEVPLRDVLDWINLCRMCAEPDQHTGAQPQAARNDMNIIPFQARPKARGLPHKTKAQVMQPLRARSEVD